MKGTVLAALTSAVVLSGTVFGGEPVREPLWPAGAPGAKGTDPQKDIPSITVFEPENPNGTAVVICPGGGYGFLATGHEGVDIAKWLNGLGITGVMLEYRMNSGGYQHPIPMMDAQRAMRTVRSRAGELGIDPSKIGIMGFSAGGHLASSVGTHFDAGDPEAVDPIDRVSCRPDFMILCYPVIAFGESYTHQGSQDNLLGADATDVMIRTMSSEKRVTAETPPTFLFATDEDTVVPAENSVMFYLALRKAGVPAELHIFRPGNHGLGLASGNPVIGAWVPACENWLKGLGL